MGLADVQPIQHFSGIYLRLHWLGCLEIREETGSLEAGGDRPGADGVSVFYLQRVAVVGDRSGAAGDAVVPPRRVKAHLRGLGVRSVS